MDKIVIVASFAVAAILLIVDITYDVVSYYRRKKLLQELIAAALKDEMQELQHSKEEDKEDACLTCKHCEECEPPDKAER